MSRVLYITKHDIYFLLTQMLMNVKMEKVIVNQTPTVKTMKVASTVLAMKDTVKTTMRSAKVSKLK